jgi:L-lysine 2,3-aminomutase
MKISKDSIFNQVAGKFSTKILTWRCDVFCVYLIRRKIMRGRERERPREEDRRGAFIASSGFGP